jgi:glycine betaine/proline transport system ATP-binding protein
MAYRHWRNKSHMTIKMRVENLIKIFGSSPRKKPLEMLQNGVGKDEIFAQTGHVVGVNGASFEVNEGEIFVVMGLSGSGKSTLIRCLNRLYEPTAGKIIIDGEDVVQADKKRLQEIRRTKMAMVFQHFGLFPHRTVGHNVAYGLWVQNIGPEECRAKALEALQMVGLESWIDHYPGSLSGGMQQRVGLARALATDADILLMDEAFSALDPLIRRQMQNEMISLQKKLKKTIIFITHDLNEALRVGDRVAIMRDGRVVQIGTPTEIVTEPANLYVARFMSDVDQSRVLSAEFSMRPAHHMPNTAKVFEVRQAMQKWNVSSLYITDKKGQIDGLIFWNQLRTVPDEQQMQNIQHVMLSSFPTCSAFTTLTELYPLFEEDWPVAVIDSHGRLLGVVYPVDVLAALATTEEVAAAADTGFLNGAVSPSSNGEIGDDEEQLALISTRKLA